MSGKGRGAPPHSAEKLAELQRMMEPPVPAFLPRVDRTAVDIEDDPEVLDARARGLWQQWQALTGSGAKREHKYPKEDIKEAVITLADNYAGAEAIPYELARLIRAIVGPRARPAPSTSDLPIHARHEAAYRAAIRYEADRPGASVAAIARHLLGAEDADGAHILKPPSGEPQKAAEALVRGWRKAPHYREQVRSRRPEPSGP